MLDGKIVVSNEDHIYRWSSQIACRTIEETAFVLFRSKMISLNSVGTFIWECFKQGCYVSRVVERVVTEFDASYEDVQQDVAEFVGELVSNNLLVMVKPKGTE